MTEGAVSAEAALIDGAGQIRMLLTIFIPVAMPGIIGATIFAFTVSRGQLPLPDGGHLLDRSAPTHGGHRHDAHQGRRLPVGSIMAGALMAAAPPVILYAFLMD